MNLTTCTIFKVPQVNLQISDDWLDWMKWRVHLPFFLSIITGRLWCFSSPMPLHSLLLWKLQRSLRLLMEWNGAGHKKTAEKVSFHRGPQCSPKKISYIDDNNRGMINYKTYPVHILFLSTMYISNPCISVREQKHSLFCVLRCLISRQITALSFWTVCCWMNCKCLLSISGEHLEASCSCSKGE